MVFFTLVSNKYINPLYLAGAADPVPVSHSCDSPPTYFSTATYFRAENKLNGHFQWNYSQRHGNISRAKLLSYSFFIFADQLLER